MVDARVQHVEHRDAPRELEVALLIRVGIRAVTSSCRRVMVRPLSSRTPYRPLGGRPRNPRRHPMHGIVVGRGHAVAGRD
jgi:hypothetical protein